MWDASLKDDGDGGTLRNTGGSTLNPRTPTKSNSSTNLSTPQPMKRRSSLARVFSTLGMSPGSTISEGAMTPSAGWDGGGGGGDSETNPNTLIPPRFRRGSSAEVNTVRAGSIDLGGGGTSTRDRLGSRGNMNISKIPRWALHDPCAIVMKDGVPVSMGTLVHHHLLLSQSQSPFVSPHFVVTPTWRLKERMKTVGICLILALNIGTDPPDLNKPTPCAKLQCWLDPTSISRAKAKERIGERLEQQYAKWQQRSKLKYRRAIDPTVEIVKDLCFRMRESAKGERVLLHYNGHGVPRPTVNGEIWLFDKHHTNYIPLSVTDLRRWIGKPSIVVLDCSGAGVLMPFFTAPLSDGGDFLQRSTSNTMDSSDPSEGGQEYSYLRAIRDTIVLCPTSQGEWLPLNPEFPADIFTSCLTTPIPIALRWFVYQNPLSMEFIDLETIADAIPGKLTDRKTPLGELNWIFTAVTDTIAWNVLPSALFQRLFRQDLLVASMFRNFLLADRILRSLGCSPMSNPELPSTCNHPLWQAWDLAVETCLHQLIDHGYLTRKGSVTAATTKAGTPDDDGEGLEKSNSIESEKPTGGGGHSPLPAVANVSYTVDAPFFAEQLTAFEIWLEYASAKPKSQLLIRCPPSAIGGTPLPFLHGSMGGDGASTASPYELDPPQELPIVLQVLLSQAHRVRALVLLKRFLDLGPSAVNLALSVGIFPYVLLKLLQSPIDEYKHVLVGIWAQVLAFDESCQVDVVKDGALPHFIRHLRWGLTPSPTNKNLSARQNAVPSSSACFEDAVEQRTMAAFILSVICLGYTLGQSECINAKLHLAIGTLLQSLESQDDDERMKSEDDLSPQFRMWLCICLGNLMKDNVAAEAELYACGLQFRLFARLEDYSPEVRTASCYALSCLVGSAPEKPAVDDSQPITSMMHHNQQYQAQQILMQPFNQGTMSMPGMNVNLNPSAMMTSNMVPPPYGLHPPDFQTQMGSNINPTAKPSFLAPVSDQPIMLAPMQPAQSYQQSEVSTVFEDKQRMDNDLTVASKLSQVLGDASPVVRFEAVLALTRFVGKYLAAFVSAVGNDVVSPPQVRSVLGGNIQTIPLPNGVSPDAEMKLSGIWSSLFRLHRSDPHPSIRLIVHSLVSSINERVMTERTKLRQRSSGRRRSMASSLTDDAADAREKIRRNATGINLSSQGGSPPQSLKRSGSIGFTILQDGSSTPASSRGMHMNQGSLAFDIADPEFFLPESKFYLWKKVEFADSDNSGDTKNTSDALSDAGAIKKYRETRNRLVQQKGQLLKDSFAVLAQKPPTNSPSPFGDWEKGGGDAASGAEQELDLKKQALHLQQVSLLKNTTARGTTSLLLFHPYEPALVVCGGHDNVTCWNVEGKAERMLSFSNENPKQTRMTAAAWINETNTSLLLTGSNDGSVRIWDGLFEPNDELSKEKPSLVSSFFAAPDISSDKRYSSGLVLEYQQFGGQLVAGGNTKLIRCWDIATEKCRNTFESKSDASLTTLTTAWNHSYNGYSGLGPDIIVGGYGNGSLRVFDTRCNRGEPAMNIQEGGVANRVLATKRRWKYSEYDEHSSWIVDVSFTTYGGRHEVSIVGRKL